MKNKIIKNLQSSLIEKVISVMIQFITIVILVRYIDRADYGLIGIVVGLLSFVSIVNITAESVFFKDFPVLSKDEKESLLEGINLFNLYKTIFIWLLSAIVIYIYNFGADANYKIWLVLVSQLFLMTLDIIVAPMLIILSYEFKQSIVTKVNIIRCLLQLVLTLPLLMHGELIIIVIRDFIIFFTMIIFWRKEIKSNVSIQNKFSFDFLKLKLVIDRVKQYSVWLHINGVITNIIYKSDTVFLSLYTNKTVVGNYNVALNVANYANILPMIIGYQNSVAISNAAEEKRNLIASAFLILSLLIGALTLFGYYLLSDYLLLIFDINDESLSMVHFSLICIVTGLVIVKSIASPLVAYINIQCDVIKFTKWVSLPILIVAVCCYWLASYYYSYYGLAIANVVVSLIWLIFVVFFAVSNGFKFELKKAIQLSRKVKKLK